MRATNSFIVQYFCCSMGKYTSRPFNFFQTAPTFYSYLISRKLPHKKMTKIWVRSVSCHSKKRVAEWDVFFALLWCNCVLLYYLLSARTREDDQRFLPCAGFFQRIWITQKGREEIKKSHSVRCTAVCLPNRLLHLRLGGHVASVYMCVIITVERLLNELQRKKTLFAHCRKL